MDNWGFGITMTIIGVGGTFVTLGFLIAVMAILKKIFPVESGSMSESK